MTISGHDPIGRVCCVAVPLLFGALSLWLGQDANWDLRNYHWYNPYALLNGRFDLDLAPAQIATFYNPLLDVPLLVAADAVPARVFGFALGALHGANFVLLYALARVLRLRWAAAIAAVGVLGGGHLGLIGTTFHDNLGSLFVLGSALLLAQAATTPSLRVALGPVVGAGTLIGLIVGLKLPSAIYGVGLAAACLALPWRWTDRLGAAVVSGAAAAAALLATGGFWMARLWASFGNPIYPYFNDVIGSDMALSASYRDQRFIPGSIEDAFAFPFYAGVKPLAVGEIEFADFRIAFLYLVLLIAASLAATRFRVAVPPSARIVLVMTVISYLAWLGIFAIYRYIVAIEMLAPLLIAALAMNAPLPERAKTTLVATAGAFLLVTAAPGTWGRVPWGTRFVSVDVPDLAPQSMVLMAGTAPLSWVIPSVPEDIPFIRLSGFSHHPRDGDIGLVRAARQRVSAHTGPFYLVHQEDEAAPVVDVAALYGLDVDRASCAPLIGNLDSHLRICAARRKVDAP